MEETRTLESALEVTQQQLAAAERELAVVRARAERDIAHARERVQRLSAAVYSLRDLLATQGDNPAQRELFRHEAVEVDTAHALNVAEGSVSESTTTEMHGFLEREPRSTTDRAVAILADAGRPMRMPELRREWRRRGWVNPDWKTPDAAITMAFHRARKAGKVGRMLDGSWVLPMMIRDELARANDPRSPDGGAGE
ncbi:hypothetical protein AB0M97_19500 [Streptomyces sp. NPDC051207]|uniref:hypothetical protein n=1 Tax=Streptomyces sp. NPDC051207 TaxID=3154641 RepID=UPI0034137198